MPSPSRTVIRGAYPLPRRKTEPPPVSRGWLTRIERGSLAALGVGERRERLEVARRPELSLALRVGLELDVEPVDGDREGRQRVDVDPRPGAEGVVARQRVGEGLPDGDDDVALPAEQVSPRHPDEDADEGDVEDEVSRLAQVALLGRQARVVVRVDAVPAPTQGDAQPLAHLTGIPVDDGLAVLGEALEAARCPGRGRADLVPEDPRARHDAADERDEEQQVDRREPR